MLMAYIMDACPPIVTDTRWHAWRRYWLRHAVGAWVELLVYAARRKRWRLLAQCMMTEALYIAAVRALWLWRPVPTLWVLVIPYLLTSLALMFGNWCAPSLPKWQAISGMLRLCNWQTL